MKPVVSIDLDTGVCRRYNILYPGDKLPRPTHLSKITFCEPIDSALAIELFRLHPIEDMAIA